MHHLPPTSTPSPSAKRIPTSLNLSHITLANPQLRTSHASNPRAVHITTTSPPAAAAAAALFPPLRLRAPLQDHAILLGLSPALGVARVGRRRDPLAHAHRHALLRQHRALGPEGLQAEVGRPLPRAARGEGPRLRRGAVDDGGGKDRGRGGVVVRGREEVRLGEEAAQLEVLREERRRVLGEGLGGLGRGGGGGGGRGGLGGGVVDDLGGLEREISGCVFWRGRVRCCGRTMNALSSFLLI